MTIFKRQDAAHIFYPRPCLLLIDTPSMSVGGNTFCRSISPAAPIWGKTTVYGSRDVRQQSGLWSLTCCTEKESFIPRHGSFGLHSNHDNQCLVRCLNCALLGQCKPICFSVTEGARTSMPRGSTAPRQPLQPRPARQYFVGWRRILCARACQRRILGWTEADTAL